MLYEIRFVQDHVEVYNEKGNFLFSADTQKEAMQEVEKISA